MAFVVPLAFFLSVITATKAEAASSVEEARQKMLEEDRRKEEEAGRAAEARKTATAELGAKAKEAGFIALSESRMNWSEAKAFCQRQGGRLPRINNSDSWDGNNPPLRGILIDGFGYGHRPWSEVGLPSDCWTGTEYTDGPGYSWVVSDRDGEVHVVNRHQSGGRRVVCVP